MPEAPCAGGCGEQVEAVKVGGQVRRYCSERCKKRMETIARRWALYALRNGVLDPAHLRAWDREKGHRAVAHSGERASHG